MQEKKKNILAKLNFPSLVEKEDKVLVDGNLVGGSLKCLSVKETNHKQLQKWQASRGVVLGGCY